MKKLVCMVMALSIIAAFTSCGNSDTSSSGISEVTSVKETSEAENNAKTDNSESNADTDKNEEVSSKQDEGSDAPNSYGFYSYDNPPETSVSIAALGGEWYQEGDADVQTLTVTSDEDIYNGTWKLDNSDGGVKSGYIKLEYSVNDGINSYWYNFYEDNGELWESFEVTGDMQLDDLYSSAGTHFKRRPESNENEQ